MNADLAQRVAEALGTASVRLERLSGGCVGDVQQAILPDASSVVVKSGADASLEIEGAMLRLLAERSDLPVPAVLHESPDLLILEHIEADGRRSEEGEREAGTMLAALHDVESERFGLEFDTLIGGLPQRNEPCDSWPAFFRDRRLLDMADQAHQAGRLPTDLRRRIDRLAARLDSILDEGPDRASLIHGDVWSGNVLWRGGRVAAFIDPGVCYADPELELAFIDLFSCFGSAFLEAYQHRRPIRPGFSDRRPILNLFPLLVHVRLVGGGYVAQVDSTLRGAGF